MKKGQFIYDIQIIIIKIENRVQYTSKQIFHSAMSHRQIIPGLRPCTLLGQLILTLLGQLILRQ